MKWVIDNLVLALKFSEFQFSIIYIMNHNKNLTQNFNQSCNAIDIIGKMQTKEKKIETSRRVTRRWVVAANTGDIGCGGVKCWKS